MGLRVGGGQEGHRKTLVRFAQIPRHTRTLAQLILPRQRPVREMNLLRDPVQSGINHRLASGKHPLQSR